MKAMPQTGVAIVPHGVQIPRRCTRKPLDKNNVFTLSYLGRINPIKNIESLIQAGVILNRRGITRWQLLIAGEGEGAYVSSLLNLISSLGLQDQVKLIGEVHGHSKEGLFSRTDVLILPSHRENFGLVVAEALARGIPVIASKGTPWEGIESAKCGLWVSADPQSMAKAIIRIMHMPLKSMGRRGRRWMSKLFTWGKVACDMYQVYEIAQGRDLSHLRSSSDRFVLPASAQALIR